MFRIDYNGRWYHEGAPIKRAALAKLFSDRALKCDKAGNYWLQTPFEKYPVEVEDVPYLIVDFEQEQEGFTLITNMGERVPLDPQHRLQLRGEQALPYAEVRDGLLGRLNRTVREKLIQIALDANKIDKGMLTLYSYGVDHPLGKL